MSEERIKLWKEKKELYMYITEEPNKNMPMYLQFYEDCIKYRDKLDIRKAVINPLFLN